MISLPAINLFLWQMLLRPRAIASARSARHLQSQPCSRLSALTLCVNTSFSILRLTIHAHAVQRNRAGGLGRCLFFPGGNFNSFDFILNGLRVDSAVRKFAAN